MKKTPPKPEGNHHSRRQLQGRRDNAVMMGNRLTPSAGPLVTKANIDSTFVARVDSSLRSNKRAFDANPRIYDAVHAMPAAQSMSKHVRDLHARNASRKKK